MLKDDQLLYPPEWSSRPAVEIVQMIQTALLEIPGLVAVAKDSRFQLANQIHRFSYHFGIHPRWAIISFGREQPGLWAPNNWTPWMYEAICGVVGRNEAGTANPQWLGIGTQLFICIKNLAWSMGEGPRANFGYSTDHYPTWPRWTDSTPPPTVTLYAKSPSGAFIVAEEKHICSYASEYGMLKYTPFIDVLASNAEKSVEVADRFFD